LLGLYREYWAQRILPAVILIATGFWNIPNIPDLRYIEVGQYLRFCFQEITEKLPNGDAVRLSCERRNDALNSWRRVIFAMRKGNGY
jgi:hypothetical protein